MINVKYFENPLPVSKLVSDGLIRDFTEVLPLNLNMDTGYTNVKIAKDDYVNDFLEFMEDAAVVLQIKDEDLRQRVITDLAAYLEKMVEKIADQGRLVSFDSFGEFILSNIVDFACTLAEDDEGLRWYTKSKLSGDFILRSEVLRECVMLIADTVCPDDRDIQKDLATPLVCNFSYPHALNSGNQKIKKFIYTAAEPMDFWNPREMPVPEFNLADAVIAPLYE